MLNVVVFVAYEGAVGGKMEIDLPGLTPELQNKLSKSYNDWDWQSNRFVFSDDDPTWLTSGEQYRKAEAKRKNSLMPRFGDTVPYILAVMFVGALGLAVWAAREGVKQRKKTGEVGRVSFQCEREARANRRSPRVTERNRRKVAWRMRMHAAGRAGRSAGSPGRGGTWGTVVLAVLGASLKLQNGFRTLHLPIRPVRAA